MNIVTEDIVIKLLKRWNVNDPSNTTQLKWHLETKIPNIGHHYLSEVYRLIIEYQKNGRQQKTAVFVKAPFNNPMYETASKWDAYVKETTMYSEVLPKIYTFEEAYFTARNHYVGTNHTLYLKDLSQSGYKPADHIQQLNFDQSASAVKCLARLHGLSVHLERTSGIPEVIRATTQHRNNKLDKGLRVAQSEFYNHLDASIREEFADKINFFKSIDWARVMDDLDSKKSAFNVLNHGDFWTNNVMFKYDKYGIIKKVKMIDFQFTRWANPATDLIYFAITSVRYDVYSKYFHLLCTIYLDSLNRILAHFNYQTYEMEDLKRDIELRYAYGISVVVSLLPLFASDPNDPINLKEAVKTKEFDFSTVYKVYKQKNFMELATKWIIHFAQKDIPEFEYRKQK